MKIKLKKFASKIESSTTLKTSFVTWAVFLSTLIVLLFTLTPAVFPALLLRTFGGFENSIGINPFEIGIFTYPFLITNFVVFSITVLYFKNKLWQPITKSIRLIFNFEISKKVAFFTIVILIGFYITFSIGELFDGKFQPDYQEHFKDWLENYSVTDFNKKTIGYHLSFFLETTSMQLFENYKVIPFIASIALLVLTYIVTVELSKKRFAGIVATVIVLQSYVFLWYDTSVSYPNFWILFYLLSLYLILKKWTFSPIAYVASIVSKPLSAPFLPMTMFFVYRANIPKKRKFYVLISYGVIIAVGGIFLLSTDSSLVRISDNFQSHDFWSGFSAVYNALRFDGMILFLMLPLTVGLFVASRRGIRYADAIMFMILGILISAPLVQAFSGSINVPYRFISLIVFFAIGTGLLLSKKVTE